MTQAAQSGTPLGGVGSPIEAHYTVKAGAATLLAPNPQTSMFLATLINTDANNGVWVSSSSGVQPGSGTFIGPQGQMQWNNQTQPPYACLDAGVHDPVQITATSNASLISNPVALGAAIALQIAQSGIPVTYRYELIDDFTFSGAGGELHTIDIENLGIASIILQLVGNVPPNNASIFYSFGTEGFAEVLTAFPVGFNVWEIPVDGPSPINLVNVMPLAAAGPEIRVWGSNKPVNSQTQKNFSTMPRTFSFSGAVVPNQVTPLLNTDGLGDQTTLNGKVTIGLSVSVVGAGDMFYQYINSLGVATYAPAFPAPSVTINGNILVNDFSHPSVPVKWFYRPAYAAAALNLSMTITPSTP